MYFFFLSYSSKRIWRDMSALQASQTKCTGSLSRGALSSPWWLLVRRTHTAVFAHVFNESFHCICCGWRYSLWFVFLESMREIFCVHVCGAIFLCKGHAPSFVVLISELERRGPLLVFKLILMSLSSTFSARADTFGMHLSRAALSKSKMQTFF